VNGWHSGDWIALFGMVVVLVPMFVGHWLAVRRERKAQRHLDRLLGHPARRDRATRDRRVTEQVWP
jgi:hypothetical protein